MNDEKELLENILDGLDRLFDRESNAIDLYVLIFATSKVLADTNYFALLDKTIIDLKIVLNSELTIDDERTEALRVTNDLRIFLAQTLDF
jgi:hypothetical protein